MDVLLNLTQSCKIMGISYSKGHVLAKSGALPFKKLGSTWVIPRSILYRELRLELPESEQGPKCA
jgi:hypothetical protein